MAGMISSTAGANAEPNVIPMIDVLLVMLIIFMLLSAVRQVTPIQVPAPLVSGGPQTGAIVLELRADGTYAINGRPVPDAALETTVEAIYAARPAKLMFIRASSDLT